MGDQQREELFAVVDQEATDEAERRDSRILYDALAARRDQVGGVSEIPAEDRTLSGKILAEARNRSAAITASRRGANTSQSLQSRSRPIPWWLWLAWITAIVAVALAFKFL
ncbi:MAG: hypothetical protein H0X38_15515 [Planctomycetes bacterium]|jgi:hypothetical protein|nr:hypothetical protein [Planctomycetota bacterium]